MADKGNLGANPITELKVSGHAMKLEPGLYCVFNAPDSPAASTQTGLPGVRISSAPGPEGGRVEIAGFEANGWIGAAAAALIRVSDAPASVVVTVYQEQGSQGEAPKLQVVTLSSAAAPAPPVSQPTRPAGPKASAAQAAPQTVEVMAHVYGRGDVGSRLSDWVGEPGSNRWIEGFAVAPSAIPASDIEYQAVLGRGWLSPWTEGSEFCGSRGMSLPILGLRVKLRGDSARTHQVHLTATFVDGTRIGPVHDGGACEAPSLAALEAFQLEILPVRQSAAPARGQAPVPRRTPGKAPPASAKSKPVAPAKARAAAPVAAKPTKAVPPKPSPKAGPSKAKATPKPAPAPAPVPARAAPAKRAPVTRRR